MNLKKKIKLILNILLSKNPDSLLKTKYQKTHIEHTPSVVLDNKLLSGKNILITGAGPMVGSGIAIELARQGANIYFTDINEKRCISLEHKLRNYQTVFKSFVADITNPEDSDRLIDYFSANKINIDVLVNNVGINLELERKGLSGFDIDKCKKTYETNVFGSIYLTKRIVRKMIDKDIKGNIIFTTSIHQELPGFWPIYSSSKSALIMLIKELATELANKGIRVNGIAPGMTKTDGQGNTFYSSKNILHKTSIEPSYIGRSTVYLASDYFSKYTTGIILKIDAGQTLKADVIQDFQ